MASADLQRASRWRTTLAGLLDAGLVAGVLWTLRSGSGLGRGARTAGALLAPTSDFVREQLASPGQRLLGIRTVDRRTGRRVALWRTALLLGVRAGGQLAAARLAPATPDAAARAQLETELAEARRLHEGNPAALQSALTAIYERHSTDFAGLPRAIAPTLATGVLNRRLRRRLAPTVEVRRIARQEID